MSEALEAELVPEINNSRIVIALSITLLIIGAIFFALSGDNAEESESQAVSQSDDGWRSFSVVAPIDTGINVYHDHFRTNETYPQWLLDGLGVNKVCELTFNGSWQERYDADKTTCWDTQNATDIVYFPGTKIIGASPDGDSDILILDDPNDGHCSAVSGAVLDSYPNAVSFFVEF